MRYEGDIRVYQRDMAVKGSLIDGVNGYAKMIVYITSDADKSLTSE